MATAHKYMSEDDLLRMPEDGYRYELVEGELRKMVPTGFEHGRCTGKLHGLLGSHVHARKLGYVLAAETGFIVARTSDGRPTVRASDIAFVTHGRVPPGTDTTRYLEIAPDLVVETISPSDTVYEIEEKVACWLGAGVRTAVTVNPASRSVTVYGSLTDITRLTDADELDLGAVIPGFRCRVSEIFD